MALQFNGTRLQYPTPAHSPVYGSYSIACRVKFANVAQDNIIFAGYDVGSGASEVRVRLMCSGSTTSGSVEMWMRHGLFAFQILKRSVGGVISNDTWHTIIATFDAAAPMHLYIDGVEPSYATSIEDTGTRPQLDAAYYLGGDNSGPVGEMTLAEFGLWDGTNMMTVSKFRDQVHGGAAIKFCNDYIEGSTSAPGLFFYVPCTMQTFNPPNEWGAGTLSTPTLTGNALTWVAHPLLVDPSPPLLDSETDEADTYNEDVTFPLEVDITFPPVPLATCVSIYVIDVLNEYALDVTDVETNA